MMIERTTTHEYPTRYAAVDQPGKLVILTGDADGLVYPAGYTAKPAASWLNEGGRELAAFFDIRSNRDWPGCVDGVTVLVLSQAKHLGGCLVEGYAAAPTFSRRQAPSQRVQAASLEEALQEAARMAEEGQAWVAHHLERERPVSVGKAKLALLAEDGRGLVMKPVTAYVLATFTGDGAIEVVDSDELARTVGLPYAAALEALRSAVLEAR